MRTHRFGRKIKLPATIAIKHQIRMLMAQDDVGKAEAQLIEQSARRAVRSAVQQIAPACFRLISIKDGADVVA
ncbi:MAG: hypothetical protein WA322_17580 [Pseudolabrys sp.]